MQDSHRGMRKAAMSTILVLCICANSCAGTTLERQTTPTTTILTNEPYLISASQLLETMVWPPHLQPITLSPTEERQLQRFIFDDVEIAAAVSDVAAIGLVRGAKPIGAVLLIGVTDPVVGNMSFIEGLRTAALDTSVHATWGPMTGSVMTADGQVWGVLPLSSVAVVAVGANRVDLDEIMNALVRRFTRQ